MFKKVLTSGFIFTQFILVLQVQALESNWVNNILSDKEHYNIQLHCKHTPTTNSFQECSASIFTEEKRLDGLKLKIDGGMPMHNHGLPTSPEIIWNKNTKRYDIKGLKFSMPGEWVLNIYVDSQDNHPKDKGQFKFSI